MSTHKFVSFVKSGCRLVGCLGPGMFYPDPMLQLAWLAAWFAAAEVLGIVEEIGEP